MAEYQEQKKDAKEGGWVTILIGVLVLLLGIAIVVGFIFMPANMEKLLQASIGVIALAAIIYMIYRIAMIMLAPVPFSPTSELKNRLIKICKICMPPTVKDLYVRGEDMHQRSRIGKIVGLGFWPKIEPKVRVDSTGQIIYKKDAKGKKVMRSRIVDNQEISEPVPEYEQFSSKDGDIVIVVQPKGFPLNIIQNELVVVLSKMENLTSLVGDIYIKDVAISPYGDYFFPSRQLQEDYKEKMLDMQGHVAMQTHYKYLDLMSDVTRVSLMADANFQKLLMAQSQPIPTSAQQTA